MYCNATICLLEPNDLFTRDGIAVWTTVNFRLFLLGKIALQETLGLIGDHYFIPFCERHDTLFGEYFHHITTMQHCLNGSQLPIDSCIVCMFSDTAMNLKGEIKCRSPLWKVDSLSFRSEYHNIIIVERSNNILDKATILQMELHIL